MQQALLDFAKTGNGNALVNAVAGSGKTSTLLAFVKVVEGTVAFAAYNKKIADEIQSKISAIVDDISARTKVGTFHSFGLRAWKRLHPAAKIDDQKIKIMMDEYRHPKTRQIGVPYEYRAFVKKAYTLARQWGAGVLPEFPFNRQEAWWDLVDHFDLRDEFENANGEFPPNVDDLVKKAINWAVYLIKYGIEIAPNLIDFEDMIYMPLRYGLAIETYDWVLVDECQDINPTRRAFAKKMMKFGSRAVFVGDRAQAIYGFTGADAKSFENIKSEFGCQEFPLTWSYRCPKKVVEFAQRYVKGIESIPDAPEGSVTSIPEAELFKQDLKPSDAIICRNNAPLVDLFFKMLTKGIAAHIEGRDIASGLIKLINRWPNLKNLNALQQKMTDYKEREIRRAQVTGKEKKAAQIADMVDAVCAVCGFMKPGSTVSNHEHVPGYQRRGARYNHADLLA